MFKKLFGVQFSTHQRGIIGTIGTVMAIVAIACAIFVGVTTHGRLFLSDNAVHVTPMTDILANQAHGNPTTLLQMTTTSPLQTLHDATAQQQISRTATQLAGSPAQNAIEKFASDPIQKTLTQGPANAPQAPKMPTAASINLPVAKTKTIGKRIFRAAAAGKAAVQDVRRLAEKTAPGEKKMANADAATVAAPKFSLTSDTDSVVVGGVGVYHVVLNATGIYTTYHNAKLVLTLPANTDITLADQDLSTLAIAGTTPTGDDQAHTLTWNFATLVSGFTADITLHVQTKRLGNLKDGDTMLISGVFGSDEATTATQQVSTTLTDSKIGNLTNKVAAVTDGQDTTKVVPSKGDTVDWQVAANIPTSENGVQLLYPESTFQLVYYIYGDVTYQGMIPATPENDLNDQQPYQVAHGTVDDPNNAGTTEPYTMLVWRFTVPDTAAQLKTDLQYRMGVRTTTNQNVRPFSWLQAQGYYQALYTDDTWTTSTPQWANIMSVPHNPTTAMIPDGQFYPDFQKGSTDGQGHLTTWPTDKTAVRNPDPAVISNANPFLAFQDAVTNGMPGIPSVIPAPHDYVYYALHESLDPNETLQELAISPFVYAPNETDVMTPPANLPDQPYISIAVKYADDGVNQYHSLTGLDNIQTVSSTGSLNLIPASDYYTVRADDRFIHISRDQLLKAGLDPTKTVKDVYFYFHKKDQPQLPTQIDTMTGDDIFQNLFYQHGNGRKLPSTLSDTETYAEQKSTSPLPAGSWAPYGLSGSVAFWTLPKAGYVGPLKRQMLPQMAYNGYHWAFSLADWYFSWDKDGWGLYSGPEHKPDPSQTIDNDNPFTIMNNNLRNAGKPGIGGWDWTSLIGPTTAEVAAPSTNMITTLQTSTAFADKDTGDSIPQGDQTVNVALNLSKNSLGNLVAQDNQPFTTYTILPAGVTANLAATQAANSTFDFSVLDHYNGTDQQVVKCTWRGMKYLTPGESAPIALKVNVTGAAPKDLVLKTYADMGPDQAPSQYQVPEITGQPIITTTQKMANGSSMDLGTGTDPLAYSGNNYVTVKAGQVQTVQQIKRQNDPDSSYSDFVKLPAGGTARVRVQTTANTDAHFTQMDLLDVLPFEKDTGLTTADDRGTTYRPLLTGPVTLPDAWQGKVHVQYTTASGVTEANEGATAWLDQDAVQDWASVTAFRILLDGASGQSIPGADQQFSFNLQTAPTALGYGAGTPVAYNSYSLVANHLLITEPHRVGLTVTDIPATPELPKAGSASDPRWAILIGVLFAGGGILYGTGKRRRRDA